MRKLLAVVAVAAFLGTTGLVLAQDTTAPVSHRVHRLRPRKRLKNQHARIKQGKKNGTINSQEASQLKGEGKDINQERKADLKKDGGKLDAADRHSLETQEDARSKEIYQDKHDGN